MNAEDAKHAYTAQFINCSVAFSHNYSIDKKFYLLIIQQKLILSKEKEFEYVF